MSISKSVIKDESGSAVSGTGDKTVSIVIKDTHVRRRYLIASAAVFILGLAMFYASYRNGLDQTASLFLTIAGISAMFLAALFYCISPAKFLRNDVCDAMCMTGTEFMYRTLVPLAVNRPVYVPSGLSGDNRTLLLVSEGGSGPALNDAGVRVQGRDFGEKDIFVVPPGYGLMEHAKRLGAAFSDEGLEDEIRDVLVNGFEMAGKVRIDKGQDRISVELRNVSVATMCATLRKRDPGICTGTGCPLCSFVGCMVAEGTGRRAIPDGASARGKTIRLSFRLT